MKLGAGLRISSGAGVVAQNDELNDFVLVRREVEREHQRLRESTLVELSVHMRGYGVAQHV